jgi:hypothetical protein
MAAGTVRKGWLAAVRAIDRGGWLGAGIKLGASFIPTGFGHFGFRIGHGATLYL